jgi:hypothetical protein
MNKVFRLDDSDGDGTIIIHFTSKQMGLNIHITDMYDNEVSAEFYKKDLIKYFKEVLNELENENE